MHGDDEPYEGHKMTPEEEKIKRDEALARFTQGDDELKALVELVKACYRNPGTGQGSRVIAVLGSLYNGDDQPQVDLSWVFGSLDDSLRKAVLKVMDAAGKRKLEGGKTIRDAFKIVGGQDGVDFLHAHTIYDRAKNALDWIAEWCKGNIGTKDNGLDTAIVRNIIQSCYHHKAKPVSLGYIGDVNSDVRKSVQFVVKATVDDKLDKTDEFFVAPFEKHGLKSWFLEGLE
jgi:hypothetical protein